MSENHYKAGYIWYNNRSAFQIESKKVHHLRDGVEKHRN